MRTDPTFIVFYIFAQKRKTFSTLFLDINSERDIRSRGFDEVIMSLRWVLIG